MAKQIGSQTIARIDDYSLYHDRLHGYLVRRTGGVTSKQYKTDPKYAAARDASSEFAIVSKTGKLIRQALSPFIRQVKDGTMVNRMNKELVALKHLDNKHTRGERRPETMLADANANKWFRIFQFNEGVKIFDLTASFPIISRKQQGLNMNTIKLLRAAFPVGATHVGLTLVRTVIDFEKGCFQTSASQICIHRRDAMPRVQSAMLHTPKDAGHCIPKLEGTEIICLQVLFFTEQNGTLVQLKGNVHSMGIVEISLVKLKNGKQGLNLNACSNQVPHLLRITRIQKHKKLRKWCGSVKTGRDMETIPGWLKNRQEIVRMGSNKLCVLCNFALTKRPLIKMSVVPVAIRSD